MATTPADELVDIVDADDTVITTVTRAEMRAGRMRHRAVFVVVASTDGRLLVHRRSDDKDLWPGLWDIAIGGVVTAGETYDEAAVRELAEEVGITGVVPTPRSAGRYADADVDALARTYHVVHDGPYVFADGEVVEARLVGRSELSELLDRERFVPDSVALAAAQLPFPFPAAGDPHGR